MRSLDSPAGTGYGKEWWYLENVDEQTKHSRQGHKEHLLSDRKRQSGRAKVRMEEALRVIVRGSLSPKKRSILARRSFY